MNEVERIAKKVLTKELYKRIKKMSPEEQNRLLPKLKKLEQFLNSKLEIELLKRLGD